MTRGFSFPPAYNIIILYYYNQLNNLFRYEVDSQLWSCLSK